MYLINKNTGVIACHNGKVYTYEVGDKMFTSGLIDKKVIKYLNYPYLLSMEEAQISVLDEIKRDYGIEWRELK